MDGKLLNKYELCKYSIQNVLPYTMRGLITKEEKEEIFTLHTEIHSLQVQKILQQIIEICNKNPEDKCKINDESEFILYCSAWLHDIGCIYGRKNHGKNSAKIIEKNLDIIKGLDDYENIIMMICGAHTYNRKKKDPINLMPKEIISPEGKCISPRYLSSIFRLADACDLDRRRAPKLVLRLLSDFMVDKSKTYWEAHANIYSCGFHNGNIIITYFEKTDLDYLLYDDLKKQFIEVQSILKTFDFPIYCVKADYLDPSENWKNYLEEYEEEIEE
jgi:hypothetical protein